MNKAVIAYLETPNNATLTYDNSREFDMRRFNMTKNETYLNYNLTTKQGLSVIGINPRPETAVIFEILLQSAVLLKHVWSFGLSIILISSLIL